MMIRYFTAKVQNRPWDPDQLARQLIYVRALQTHPRISVHWGKFQTKPRNLPLLGPWRMGQERRIRFMRTEEKESDVNLATHLVADGFRGAYDVAVVVTNDSDFKEPIRVVRTELGLEVGVVITDPKTRQSGLPADFHRRISDDILAACQLPGRLSDATGTIRKPATWP